MVVVFLLSQLQSRHGQIAKTSVVFISQELIHILVEFKEDLQD